MLSPNIHRSRRPILWILMICLAACSIPGTWGRAPAPELALLSTPTVVDAKIYFPIVMRNPCTVILNPGSIHYDGSDVLPGGIICLNSGDYQKIVFENLRGTPDKPITITNYDGLARVVNGELVLRDCQHVRLTGTGTPGIKYGICAHETLVSAYNNPGGIEIDHVEVADQRLAVAARTDPADETTDIHIHHNYLHCSPGGYPNTVMYIGHAHYDQHPGDYVMRRVEIDHNLIDGADGQAIKVASIVEDCRVHHNRINDVVRVADTELQSAAILIGHGCQAEVYNNIIINSGGHGILGCDGFFGSLIYNNLLVNTGQDVEDEDAFLTWGHGYRVFNNTIIGANRFGIAFRANEHDNAAYNNVILGTGSDSLWKVNSPDANFHHNLTREDGYTAANFGFADPANGDYRLTKSSPAVDAGATPSFPLNFDLDDRPRPVGEYDVGAFER